MTTTTTTPNMNLVVPVASEAPGPDWATEVVSDMYAIDSHNHAAGQGVAINPGGLNINSDLPFGGNNATALKSARFTAQSAPLAAGSDLGCIYVSGKDLYYNDEDGNQVRITTGGNVNAGAGSITGLPSGTASVAFAAATYTFLSATNTGATISAGPVAIGSTTAGGKQTTLASNASQVANIALVLPTAAPAAGAVLGSDASGNTSWLSSTGTGNTVVQSTSPTIITPNIDGNPTGALTGSSYTTTIVSTLGTVSPNSWFYFRIGSMVLVYGSCSITPASLAAVFTATVPILPSSNFAGGSLAQGVLTSYNTVDPTRAQEGAYVAATTGAKTVDVNMRFINNSPYTVGISFMYSAA